MSLSVEAAVALDADAQGSGSKDVGARPLAPWGRTREPVGAIEPISWVGSFGTAQPFLARASLAASLRRGRETRMADRQQIEWSQFPIQL